MSKTTQLHTSLKRWNAPLLPTPAAGTTFVSYVNEVPLWLTDWQSVFLLVSSQAELQNLKKKKRKKNCIMMCYYYFVNFWCKQDTLSWQSFLLKLSFPNLTEVIIALLVLTRYVVLPVVTLGFTVSVLISVWVCKCFKDSLKENLVWELTLIIKFDCGNLSMSQL